MGIGDSGARKTRTFVHHDSHHACKLQEIHRAVCAVMKHRCLQCLVSDLSMFCLLLRTARGHAVSCPLMPVSLTHNYASLAPFLLISRTLQVNGGCISFQQRPGSFYVGNLCALSHNVVHGEHAAGSYGGTRRRSRCKSLLCCEPTFSERREPAHSMPHQGLRSCSKS